MVKQAETIRRQFADESFEFDHFVGLALKGLIEQLTSVCSNLFVGNMSVEFHVI